MALMRYREANQVLWRGVRPAHNGTAGGWYQSTNALGLTTVVTAHAALTTYITYFFVSLIENVAYNADLIVRTAVPADLWHIWRGRSAVGYKGDYIAQNLWPPLEIEPTYTVDLNLSVGHWTYVGLLGWRE